MEISPLPEGLEDARLQRLAAYWDARRGDRAMPARADLDPLDMGWILGNLALVEVRRDGSRLQFRFRLFGVNLVADMGFDPTGQDLDAYQRQEMREILRASYTEAVQAARPFRRRRQLVMDGRQFDNESLLLPLAADGRTVDMLLVAVILRERT
ncbi:PAS domain-containing protein [Ferrovibrio sp.]|uniref:PAS domain-containing protein n=1 Tax=Ferrovibrio sp. TaxID=1917215 RepID=UPI00311DA8E8